MTDLILNNGIAFLLLWLGLMFFSVAGIVSLIYLYLAFRKKTKLKKRLLAVMAICVFWTMAIMTLLLTNDQYLQDVVFDLLSIQNESISIFGSLSINILYGCLFISSLIYSFLAMHVHAKDLEMKEAARVTALTKEIYFKRGKYE